MEDNETPFSQTIPLNINKIFSVFSRTMGIIVLLIGIWVIIRVVDQVWELFEKQTLVVNLAANIEKESNVDKAIAHVLDMIDRIPQQLAAAQLGAQQPPQPQPQQPIKPRPEAKISYFIAWFIVIVLLFLIAKIGCWAATSGGQLAIYNADVENVARAMVKEILSRPNV